MKNCNPLKAVGQRGGRCSVKESRLPQRQAKMAKWAAGTAFAIGSRKKAYWAVRNVESLQLLLG